MNTETKKQGNKKLLSGIAILALLIVALGAIYFIFAPKASEGSKTITLSVVDDTGAETTYDVKTDAEYLREVFDEVEGLTVVGTDGDYGLYIDTVNGVTADFNANGAYWSIYVNGEVAQNGADTQPVTDGDDYSLVYEVYQMEE